MKFFSSPQKSRLILSLNIQNMWDLANLSDKLTLQNAIFPEGIYYDLEKGLFRTERVNTFFELTASFSEYYEGDKKKESDRLRSDSRVVEPIGQVSNPKITKILHGNRNRLIDDMRLMNRLQSFSI